ncbi:MAG TPA: Ig-like domain-containing protein [Chitinophagaceae bacterium]|nr:Ig-like domain-containing protein [Chitinophagaceae bacterium]
MKKFTQHIFLLLGVLGVCQLNSKLLAQEGTKQFIQSIDNNGEEDTMCIALMNGNDTDPTLHTYGSPPKGRMYFGFKNGENAYMGANAKFKDFPNNTVNFRVRGPIVGNPLTASAAAIVFGPQPTPGEVFSNFGEGYIANPSQAIIGAQEVNGPGGYDGILILDSTKATGIYYIEFDNASNNDLAQLSYFDLSIKKANGQPASGRLFSYAWSLYNKLEGYGFKVSDLDFFVYHTKDSTVTELNWDNVEPGGFSLQVNESGPLDINPLSPTLSEDRIIARQSTPYAVVSSNAVNPMFPVFFTVPDTSFFPFATTAPDIIVDSIDRFCPFTDSFKFILTKESLVDVFLDLDGNDKVYTPNTADVLLIAGRSPAGPLATLWNGNDGNNNIVPLSQSINIIFNVIAGEIHLPLGDFEENPLGFNGSIISPAFAQSSFLKIYHDDTQFPSSTENLQPLNLDGCITNSCHLWGNGGANNSSYGNARWINTWWTSYEKQIEFSFQKICLAADPDFNATWVNVPVSGDVSTNDENWPIGTTYGTPTAIPGNPDGSMPALSPDGSYTFISPVPGVFKFLVPVCAPGVVVPNCDETLLTITVLEPNESTNPPVANVDIATTPVNTPVTLNTLANDKAGNVGNILVPSTVAIVDSPNNGTITVDPVSGNTTYTPNSGFVGQDTLEYTVCDNQVSAKCARAFQIITIEAVNATNSTVAADDYETTPYNTPVSGNAMLNDSDPQGQPQTITPQTTTIPGKGTLVLDATGTFTFTPVEGFSGPVEFPYTTCDNGSPIACANATIHILVPLPPVIVPIKMNYFTINSTQCEVKINWGTQSEVNTSHFNILRKSSKETAFISIAKLNAAGNSETQKDYSYTDTDLRKDQYEYKIETVDIDQSNSSSDIRSVNALCVHQNISVYPNPVTDNIKVRINTTENSVYQIKVVDFIGRTVMQTSITLEQGTKEVLIPANRMPAGLYQVNVISELGTQSLKIQKTK